MKIIDISLELNSKIISYPGNPKLIIKKFTSIPEEETNSSLITIGSHAGTHIDAPLHVKKNGKTTNEIPLEKFYGKCSVLNLEKCGKEIRKEHLKKFRIKKGEIVILKTENSKNQYKKFRKNFAHLSLSGAEYLLKKGIKAVGIDYLGIEKFGSKELVVHKTLLEKIPIIEGLYLKNAKPGKYIFAGFPLKAELDGSPIRAVLIKN